MGWLSLITAGLKALSALTGVTRLFSDWQQRKAGATAQRADDLNKEVNVLQAEQQAAANAPTTREELEETLHAGKL